MTGGHRPGRPHGPRPYANDNGDHLPARSIQLSGSGNIAWSRYKQHTVASSHPTRLQFRTAPPGNFEARCSRTCRKSERNDGGGHKSNGYSPGGGEAYSLGLLRIRTCHLWTNNGCSLLLRPRHRARRHMAHDNDRASVRGEVTTLPLPVFRVNLYPSNFAMSQYFNILVLLFFFFCENSSFILHKATKSVGTILQPGHKN
jgi:hypothetical protein